MQSFWSMSQKVAVFVYGAPLDQCLGPGPVRNRVWRVIRWPVRGEGDV